MTAVPATPPSPSSAGESSNGVNGVNGTNGYTNGANGPSNGVNGHANGINGHSNGINGHSNGVNGHSNGVNGHVNGDHTNDHQTNGHMNGDGVNGHELNGHQPNEFETGYTHGYTHGYAHSWIKANAMPIAIVGMSCRLPGNVATPSEFWELCSRARSGWSEIPKERFDNASFHHPNPGKSGCYNPIGGNFLKGDLQSFDAPFFNLTAQEATSMDPQQRMLLECTFEALENAGIPKHSIVGKDVGVFIGGSFSEYEAHLFRDSDTIPMYQATGCAFAMQSNRLSHFFDLRGPSFTSDTACSSSLVALHLACQSLRSGESTHAIVGGCHLNMLPEFWVSMSMSRLFSDQGRSFSFDNRGTGYGRGEGCGMIILKPLEQALKDNDTIRAVIRGSGINQDGKTPGITMPNGDAQESLIRSVYKNAGLDVSDCGYVEAHGTGTKVGDPIEAKALYNTLAQGRSPKNPLYIGSVKSNIGHLEAASGIVAVMKAALMLERGFILPNHDFKKPNEKIPFAEWNLKVPTTLRPWPKGKRLLSVNNFGFGGTNAHVVLERAPMMKKHPGNGNASPEETPIQGRKIFVLSANDKVAMEALMKNTGIYLEQRPEIFQLDLLNNVAYTLGQRRSLHQWRVAVPAMSSFELIESLSSGKVTPSKETDSLRIGFIFTGQGAQWWAMGRELYDQYPVFTAAIDLADQCLAALGAAWSLVDELRKDEKKSAVNKAHISQPACTAVQLALTDLLRSWGIRPTAVAGHSSGEIGAAYAAGIVNFESCMTAAYHRGRLIPVLKERFSELRGSMMAVGGSEEDITPLLSELREGQAKIACFNSPSSLTISGDEPAIFELEKLCEAKQMFNRRLQVDTAYHSHHMNLIAEEYLDCIQWLDPPVSTDVKFHSSLLGQVVDGSRLQPTYWVDNLTCPVRFSEAVQSMVEPRDGFKTGVNMLVELGPHSALQGPIKQILKAVGANAMKIPYASALIRKKDAVESALDLAATLFTKGAVLDMDAINFPRPGKQPALLTDMPRYPWNLQTKYWHESRMTQKHKHRTPRNDLIGTLANYSNDFEPTWRNIVRADDLPWLRHHKIQGLTLFPMSGFVAMALEAASQRAGFKDVHFDKFELRDVSVHTPLMITDDDVEMTITLRPHQEASLVSSDVWDEFYIHSWAQNKGWTEHCKGLVTVKKIESNDVDGLRQAQDAEALLQSTISAVNGAATSSVVRDSMYESLSELGVSYGPTFQGIDNCQACECYSKADVIVPDVAQEMPNHHLTSTIVQPAFLESLIEMYWPILGAGRAPLNTIYLPSSIGRVSISRDITAVTKEPGKKLQAYCKGNLPLTTPRATKVTMFATAQDNPAEAFITLDELTIAPILESELLDVVAHRELCYKLEWEPILETLHEDSKLPEADLIIVHGESELQQQIASRLAESLQQATGKMPALGSLEEVNTDGKTCIFLSELDKPFLASLTTAQFTALQRILTSVQGVLWVVRGAYTNSSNPDAEMVRGLSRTIRSETLLPFATLDMDLDNALSEESTTKAILDVFKAVFGSGSSGEMEFMERSGSFYTPRIVNDAQMNEFVHNQTADQSGFEYSAFTQEGRPLKMAISSPGAPDSFYFVDDKVVEESLQEDQIEIQVKAIGMNYEDVLVANGELPKHDFGFEASGVVTSVGSNVSNLKVGDRVAAKTQGSYSNYARTKATFAFKIPHDMSFDAAATIPLAYSTAYYSLIDLGRLEEGETVLIHAAADGVAHAAIALAQMIGAEVFTTVGSADEKEFLIQEYGLPESHIFYSRESSFGKAIRRATKDQGVDIVLNTLMGDALRASWDCLSNFGRFVDIGRRNRTTKMNLEMARFDNNASFMTMDLLALAAERPKVMKRLLSDVSKLLKYGKIRPVAPITAFPISDLKTAFTMLENPNTQGKLVVVPHAEDVVKATASKLSNKLLRPDGTYILIGGTGGLGRSMAKWMVGKGARNIVLISRSGSATGKVKDLVDQSAEVGANIVVRRCNVADKADVAELISNGLQGMPPVRGVIHGAMVLRDVLFEKMTYDEYVTVIESKVHGAWNFHHALAGVPLDFFIAISSAAGAVGNRGQAAYAAANTFLNAFVQHRVSQGLHADSIDLTAVSDAGYLADDAEKAAEVARNLGSDTICEAEVLALIGAAISGRMGTACNHHCITGMRITATMRPFWTDDAKFKHLKEVAEAEAAAMESSDKKVAISWNSALKGAKTLEEAQEVACKGLVEKISAVLMMEAEEMDTTRALSNYPLDSLVAIEIRNFITREFEATLQVLELLSSGSIETLAKVVCTKSKAVSIKE